MDGARKASVVAAAAIALAAALGACAPSETDDQGDARTDADGRESGCNPSAYFCSDDRTQVLSCDPAGGAPRVVSACDAPQICISGACITPECPPRRSECVDEGTQRTCRNDGSGWDVIPCGEGMRCSEDSGACETPCELRIFILQDQSGSMSDLTPTKWEQARDAVGTVMTSGPAADVEWGFGAFPTDGNCGTEGVVIYPIPEATADNVDEYFTDHGPDGNTPLVWTMESFLADTSAGLNDPAYHNAILVVSDGQDTCLIDCLAECGPWDFRCLMDCETRAEADAAAALADATRRLRDELQIRSFAIGFGEGVSDLELSAIAENGGTALGEWIAADNVDELTAALDTILAEMRECNPILY